MQTPPPNPIIKKAADTALSGARLVGMLALFGALWIAASIVDGVVGEREGRRKEAEAEISSKWGHEQSLAGPLVVAPYYEVERTEVVEDKIKKLRIRRFGRKASFLPESYDVQGVLEPEVRYRGIFETVVYVAKLVVSGSYVAPDLGALKIPAEEFRPGEAVFSFGVSDPRGIQDAVKLEWGGVKYKMEPGAGEGAPWATGMHAKGLPLPGRGKSTPFRLELKLNGSRGLNFMPAGRSTGIHLKSTWQDPSFTGEYLPQKRELGPEGFSADWSVQELARSFPQQWKNTEVSLDTLTGAGFGVGLIKTAGAYQQTSRATKYAVLFILLTFFAFFLFEIFGSIRIHPLQYLFAGASLVVFYLLLLSLSEHAGFVAAYAISTAATVGLLWAYVKAVLKDATRARMLTGLILGLYIYLFVILRLDDYALLMGSLAVFAALAAAMLLTRKVDWYSLGKPKP